MTTPLLAERDTTKFDRAETDGTKPQHSSGGIMGHSDEGLRSTAFVVLPGVSERNA